MDCGGVLKVPEGLTTEPARPDKTYVRNKGESGIPEKITSIRKLLPDLAGYYKNQKVKEYDELLKWVGEHDSELTAQFRKDYKELSNRADKDNLELMEGFRIKELKGSGFKITDRARFNFILGVWLGSKYIASMYKKEKKQWPVEICLSSDLFESSTLGYDPEKKRIYVGIRLLDKSREESDSNSFVVGFNGGIHECTHALLYTNYADETNVLSEMATFYTQIKHGLPLESKAIKREHFGDLNLEDLITCLYDSNLCGSKRDFVHFLDEIRRGTLKIKKEDLRYEYLAFMVGPWVRKFYLETRGEPDIFKFRINRGKDTNAVIGWSGGHFELSINDFCSASGITDQGLISKLTKAFDRINKEQCKNADSFFESFERNMNGVFGKPKSDVPDGFVHHEENFERKGKVTPESVPKKVRDA